MSSDAKPLSRREQLAIQGVVAGKTATVALLEAGYSKSVAETQQKAVLGKPRVQSALLKALEEEGVSTQFLARTIREGLAAEKSVFHEGRRVAQEPDHANRHRFVRTTLQLTGDLQPDAADQGDTWEAMIFAIRARRASTEGSST